MSRNIQVQSANGETTLIANIDEICLVETAHEYAPKLSNFWVVHGSNRLIVTRKVYDALRKMKNPISVENDGSFK